MYDTGRFNPSGKRCLSSRPNPRLPFEQAAIPVPCGKCKACLDARRREWISRLRLELLQHDVGSFVTLTYKDNPRDLFKYHVQRFIKRLRNASRDFGVPRFDLRYFFGGEFGTLRGRPHWHGLLFGIDCLSDPWLPWCTGYKDLHPIFSSKLLEKIWTHGIVSVDKITPFRVKYVAKYVTKENCCCLHSQGLGRSFFVDVSRKSRKVFYRLRDTFLRSLNDGSIVVPDDGMFSRIGIPKAFDRYIERVDLELYESIKARRASFASNSVDFRSSKELERSIDVYNSLENQKRILHNEETHLLGS